MTQHAHLERRLNELARELELACRLKDPTKVMFRIAAELRGMAAPLPLPRDGEATS